MKITIDTDLIQLARDEAGNVTLHPEACKAVAQYHELKKIFEGAEEEIKEKTKIAMSAEGVESVAGEGVKISMYPYGSKYSIDEPNLNYLPKDWYEIKTSYSLISEKVEDYVKKENKLPLGVIEPERKLTLRITVKTPNGN